MRVIEVENLYEMWTEIGRLFLKEEITLRGAGQYFLYLYNVTIESDSSEMYILCLEDMGYSARKITHLLKSYIEPSDVNKCFENMDRDSKKWKLGGLFSDYSIEVKSGGCILGISYRDYWDPTLTVYSRSMEFPRKALADIMLISSIASLLKERFSPSKKIKIVWYIGTIWISSYVNSYFYKIAMLPYEVKYINDNFQNNSQRGWDRFMVNQDKASYRPLKSAQRRYKERTGKINEIHQGKLNSDKFLTILKKYLGR